MNVLKYNWFFIPLLIGLFGVVFLFINNISKISKLKTDLIINKNVIGNIETCPEYWKKNTNKEVTTCSSQNISENSSIGTIKENGTNKNKWNTVNYTEFNLNEINIQPNDEKCKKIFKSYYQNLEKPPNYTIENQKKITWVEYYNKCLKQL
jgi:hypothetical protein